MKIKLDKKKIIKVLVIIALILIGIIVYAFIISPAIQNMKVEANKQGVINVIGYLDNQIQINGFSKINLGDKVILCQYGK